MTTTTTPAQEFRAFIRSADFLLFGSKDGIATAERHALDALEAGQPAIGAAWGAVSEACAVLFGLRPDDDLLDAFRAVLDAIEAEDAAATIVQSAILRARVQTWARGRGR